MKETFFPTGAAVALIDPESRLLLLKRAPESRWMPDKWGLPGGKIEEGETPISAATRETLEETSLEINSLKMILVDEVVAIYFSNTYAGNLAIDSEHTDVKWVSEKDLPNYDTVPRIKEIYQLAVKHAKN
tara:strand:- start:1857 stop:2246 length:390 start_codon:yes stop_codon:yes gene_type:complete